MTTERLTIIGMVIHDYCCTNPEGEIRIFAGGPEHPPELVLTIFPDRSETLQDYESWMAENSEPMSDDMKRAINDLNEMGGNPPVYPEVE